MFNVELVHHIKTSSLPRVVAIIAEALAVEVLPPDHPSKARLIGIIKQVQVSVASSCMTSSLDNAIAGQRWSV